MMPSRRALSSGWLGGWAPALVSATGGGGRRLGMNNGRASTWG